MESTEGLHEQNRKREEMGLNERVYIAGLQAKLALEYTRMGDEKAKEFKWQNINKEDQEIQQTYEDIFENIKTIILMCLLEDTLNAYIDIIELYGKNQGDKSTELQKTLMEKEIETVRNAITTFLT